MPVRRSERKNFESEFLLKQSREAHERDVKNNQSDEGWKPWMRKSQDTRTEASKEFARRWLGGQS